ncbi:MAG: hypothetical protein OEZ39_01675 [Gammaproteobacteria bacterium]|nr:hypothetical protein [Gammaproteobacteria bacterium]MDH5650562.1 hypothetical protein [Gammaproteobacteria bacterium]
MKTDDLRWFTFVNIELPEVLFGETRFMTRGKAAPSFYDLEKGETAVGFNFSNRDAGYHPPSIIVVDDKHAAETFSWLRTYAVETSPVSQFARVISLTDWENFSSNILNIENYALREDRWSSIIVGEALGQGEINLELQNMPISRAMGCFSTAIARTEIIHNNKSIRQVCIDRLMMLENDRNFVKRTVHVKNLKSIWDILRKDIDDIDSAIDAAKFVVQTVINNSSGLSNDIESLLIQIEDYTRLTSDSVEERVVEFHKLADRFLQVSSNDALHIDSSSAALAAAAFLVGRSTSHVFLLQKVSRRYPTSYAWFGLIAGLCGPSYWDLNWSRAAKGVERLLRTTFNWNDPPVADLCWLEYSWFSKTFDRNDSLINLPKFLPRVLSIEIMPGASCQLRLVSAENTEKENQLFNHVSEREKELQIALSHFMDLAEHTKAVLYNKNKPEQQNFQFKIDIADNSDSKKATHKKPKVKSKKNKKE